MKLQVKLFAATREIAGADSVELEVPEAARVADIRSALAQRFPEMETLAPTLLVAIGSDYADDRTPVSADAEVACFPPVSGG